VAGPSSTARNVRIGVLLAVLVAVVGWGYKKRQALGLRRDWLAPLPVAVVLVSEQPLAPATVEAWRRGLAELEEWGEAEFERHRGPMHFPPISYRLATPVVAPHPPLPPADVSLSERATAALAFEAAARELDEAAGVTSADTIVIDVLLGAGPGTAVEGLAEREGRRGVVMGSATETELDLELVAMLHEVLHCTGATDKYDAEGRAVVPAGLAEPELSPRYPQNFGEVMVGEVPLSETSGRPIRSLGEALVGPVTAKEIGWVD
jgi:hypothetical protein